MKLKISISTRLVFWITLLVCLLFGSVLAVIQNREAAILSEEAEARALLLAESMKDANFQSLFRQDLVAIQGYVDDHIDEDMPYIVFYDKLGRPYVAGELVPGQGALEPGSRLPEGVGRDDPPFSEEKVIQVRGRGLRVREVEIAVFPPNNEDPKWASVMIGMSLEPMYAKLREIQKVLLLIAAGGFFLGIAGAALLARRITRPLHRLVEGTVRISKGDFSQAIAITSRDEVGDLARSFNEMTGQLL
ncbi:MAG: HAMP domain-containing protein, partial [Candidatus Aminicenantes bacterium]|nr:HAMP domain-containing protein [Candidatus Aminicenantes bacterium]